MTMGLPTHSNGKYHEMITHTCIKTARFKKTARVEGVNIIDQGLAALYLSGWFLISICSGFSSSQRDHICLAAEESNKRLMFISPSTNISLSSAQAVSSMLEVVPELPTRVWSLLNCANQYCLLPVGPNFSYCSDHTPNIHAWLASG